jgi:hypothetical protein
LIVLPCSAGLGLVSLAARWRWSGRSGGWGRWQWCRAGWGRRRHRHQEFLPFLKLIDAAVPDGLELHLVCDNYATHKTPDVKKWLLRHPRFHRHLRLFPKRALNSSFSPGLAYALSGLALLVGVLQLALHGASWLQSTLWLLIAAAWAWLGEWLRRARAGRNEPGQ